MDTGADFTEIAARFSLYGVTENIRQSHKI